MKISSFTSLLSLSFLPEIKLPPLVVNTLKKTGWFRMYIGLWFIMICIDFLQQSLMVNIVSNKYNNTDSQAIQIEDKKQKIQNILAVIVLIQPILRHGVFGSVICRIKSDVLTEIWRQLLIEYNSLSTDAKSAFTTKELERKIRSSEWGIAYWIEYGFPTIFTILSSVYMCIHVFYLSNLLSLFFGLVVGVSILYVLIKKKIDKRMSELWINNEKQFDKLSSKILLNLPRYAHGSRNIEHIIKLVHEDNRIKNNIEMTRNQQKIFTGILNQLCLALVLICVSPGKILGLLTVIVQFTSTVNNVFGLLNSNIHFEEKWNILRKKFDKYQKIQNDPIQVPFDQPVSVIAYNLSHNGIKLSLKNPLELKIGNKILITGPSGAGKTTFLKGIFGLDNKPDVRLSNGLSPRSYYSNISLMYQSIKEDLQFDSLTLREVFDGTNNEQLVEEVLSIAHVGKWVDRLKQKVITDKTNNDYVINIDDDVKYNNNGSWLDIDLSEIGQLSGGEKTRLAIAIQLFELVTQNKKVLILDEPEQGTDPPIAYKVIESIVKKYGDNTLIVIISHLEKLINPKLNIDRSNSNIQWSNHVTVENNIINVI